MKGSELIHYWRDNLLRFLDASIEECTFQSSGDERVCQHCAELDGKKFNVKYLIEELQTRDGLLHKCENKDNGCRCVLIAVLPELEGEQGNEKTDSLSSILWAVGIMVIMIFVLLKTCV